MPIRVDFYADAPKGIRNNTLVRVAGARWGQGWSEEEVLQDLHRFNNDHCKPPEHPSKIKSIAKWVAQKPRRKGGRIPASTPIRDDLEHLWDILSRAHLKDRNGSRRAMIGALMVLGCRANTMTPEVSFRLLARTAGLSLRTVMRYARSLYPFITEVDSDETQGDDFLQRSTRWRICEPAILLLLLRAEGIAVLDYRIDNFNIPLVELSLGTTVTTYDRNLSGVSPEGDSPANKSLHPLAIGGAWWRHGALGKLGRRVYIRFLAGLDSDGIPFTVASRVYRAMKISRRAALSVLHRLAQAGFMQRLKYTHEVASGQRDRRVIWWMAEHLQEVMQVIAMSRWWKIDEHQEAQFSNDREDYAEWRYKQWRRKCIA